MAKRRFLKKRASGEPVKDLLEEGEAALKVAKLHRKTKGVKVKLATDLEGEVTDSGLLAPSFRH